MPRGTRFQEELNKKGAFTEDHHHFLLHLRILIVTLRVIRAITILQSYPPSRNPFIIHFRSLFCGGRIGI
jgi:hypothetical protein